MPVQDAKGSMQGGCGLHVIQSSLKAKKNSGGDTTVVPNVFEMYRRVFHTGQREDDLIVYQIKKKHPRGHKRKRMTSPLEHLARAAAAQEHARRGDEVDEADREHLDVVTDAFNEGEAAAILKSVRDCADLQMQAAIDSAVTRADLRAECWAVMLLMLR